MGLIIKFENTSEATDPRTEQTASWAIIDIPKKGHCLLIKGHPSADAKNQGRSPQNMVFPKKFIGEFESIIKEWKSK